MLSKFSIRSLSLLRFPSYRFSQQKVEQDLDDEWDDRSIEADQANPKLQQKEQALSMFKIFSRIFWWSTSALFFYNLYLNNNTTDPTKELGYQYHVNQAAKYCQDQYQAFYDFMTKPPIDKLLPDMPDLPFGYEIPKTLVLNISGTLLSVDYVLGVGGEFKKRNGLQKFLEKLPRQYEVVILSDDDTMFTQSMVAKLDPARQIFAGAFGRESLVFEKGKYIRDLKYLNRPLNRLIVIDSELDRNYMYQDNTILIKPFDGQNNDDTLNDLGIFLEHLAKPQIKDIRAELIKFGNQDPQIKYKEELKAREINIKTQMNRGVFGLLNQKKNPQFERK